MNPDVLLPPIVAAPSARASGIPGSAGAATAATFSEALSAAATRDADPAGPGPARRDAQSPDAASDAAPDAASDDATAPLAGQSRSREPALPRARSATGSLAPRPPPPQTPTQAGGTSAEDAGDGVDGPAGVADTPTAGDAPATPRDAATIRQEAGASDAPAGSVRRVARPGAGAAETPPEAAVPDSRQAAARPAAAGFDDPDAAAHARHGASAPVGPGERAAGPGGRRTAAGGSAAPFDAALAEASAREAGTVATAATGDAPTARAPGPGAGQAAAGRPGAARPAGARDAGRGAAGPTEPGADTASPGAGIADLVRAIGDRLRSAATERSADPAPALPPASPASPAGALAARAEAGPAEAALPSYPVTVPVHDPRFADAFGERISWLLREGLQVAELTLHPHELGPIRIELALAGDAATIDVIAAQAETRGAIEQSLPRLRELLAQHGVQLGGTTVDSGSRQQGGSGSRASERRGEARGTGVAPLDGVAGGVERSSATPVATRAGRIDVFA